MTTTRERRQTMAMNMGDVLWLPEALLLLMLPLSLTFPKSGLDASSIIGSATSAEGQSSIHQKQKYINKNCQLYWHRYGS